MQLGWSKIKQSIGRGAREEAGETSSGAEYEREPVPEHAWLGLKSYVGQFAGEHVAGTELMIGPLFLAAGSVRSTFVGLFVGNLLAVLG